MVDILHRVGVVTPTPDPVYEALTTPAGLRGWWTEDVAGWNHFLPRLAPYVATLVPRP